MIFKNLRIVVERIGVVEDNQELRIEIVERSQGLHMWGPFQEKVKEDCLAFQEML